MAHTSQTENDVIDELQEMDADFTYAVKQFIRLQRKVDELESQVLNLSTRVEQIELNREIITEPRPRDPLFKEAARVLLDFNQVSASFLQRILKVGYARAAYIIDELETAGYIGPAQGAKAREIYITKEMFDELNETTAGPV